MAWHFRSEIPLYRGEKKKSPDMYADCVEEMNVQLPYYNNAV